MEIMFCTEARVESIKQKWLWVISKFAEVYMNVGQIAEDDPRRIIHCLKVRLVLSVVSSVYYLRYPLMILDSAMWAVLNVAVAVEYSVGSCPIDAKPY